MLRTVSSLKGSTINATDGEIGHVDEAFFDDEAWAVRYLVVDTGSWMTSRKVLISPYSVAQPLGSGRVIDVALTR
ncbi:MAG: PRC-barrel domain-containing protein, partial [Caldimonas sp.]